MPTVAGPGPASDWGADFFGTLNEMPPEPVALIAEILEAMSTLPAYQDARRWLLQNLGLSEGSSVVEAGCGTGGALLDVLSTVGTSGRIVGYDPTAAFLKTARARALQLGSSARYEVGDIRSIPAAPGEFDAAFCDKVLIHAGPTNAALSEMKRVTRDGGWIGAVEWLPLFSISSNFPVDLDAFNGIFRKACYEYFAGVNLARHFHAAGLTDVRVRAFLAETNDLNSHPYWRTFLVQQMPLFIHADLIDAATAARFLKDLENLNDNDEFSASFVVYAAVGEKPT